MAQLGETAPPMFQKQATKFRLQTHTNLCLQWINQHCSRGHKPVYRVFRLTAQLYIYHADLSAFLPLDDMPSNMPQQIWSAVQDLAGIDSGGCICPYCVASTASHASNCTAALALHNRLTQSKQPISIKSILLSIHLCHGGFTEHLTYYQLAICCCRHPHILQHLPPQNCMDSIFCFVYHAA